jgi:hypothetical protein
MTLHKQEAAGKTEIDIMSLNQMLAHAVQKGR